MIYVKGDKPRSTAIWQEMLSMISTAPASKYPLPQECYPDLLPNPTSRPSPSGFRRISSIRAWWTSKATASPAPKI